MPPSHLVTAHLLMGLIPWPISAWAGGSTRTRFLAFLRGCGDIGFLTETTMVLDGEGATAKGGSCRRWINMSSAARFLDA